MSKFAKSANLLRVLQKEEQHRLDFDGRSLLFMQGSPDYCPAGSLLRVFYYTHPLPTGLSFPLTPIKFNGCIQTDNRQTLVPKHSVEFLNNNKRLLEHPPVSFWGMLIRTHRNGVNSTILLRNIIDEVPVEISFKLYSPLIVGIQVLRRAKQGRSRIYWMRERPLDWIYKNGLPSEQELNETNPFFSKKTLNN